MTTGAQGGAGPAGAGRGLRCAVFRAVPDDGRLPAVIGADAQPVLQVIGHADLPPPDPAAAAGQWREVWSFPGRALALPPDAEAVINLCADPDLCELGLEALDAALPAGMPVLNHPRAVALSRRDLAAAVFADIPGLRVPRALRFVATGPGAFRMAFAEGAFRYPVDLVPAGAAGLQDALTVAGPDGWDAVLGTAWGRRAWTMVQAQERPSPWTFVLSMAGREGFAEVRAGRPVGQGAKPPVLPPDLPRKLARLACRRLPLDLWTLVATVERDGRLRFLRAIPGLARRGVLQRETAALLAAPHLWRGAAPVGLPPVAGPPARAQA